MTDVGNVFIFYYHKHFIQCTIVKSFELARPAKLSSSSGFYGKFNGKIRNSIWNRCDRKGGNSDELSKISRMCNFSWNFCWSIVFCFTRFVDQHFDIGQCLITVTILRFPFNFLSILRNRHIRQPFEPSLSDTQPQLQIPTVINSEWVLIFHFNYETSSSRENPIAKKKLRLKKW